MRRSMALLAGSIVLVLVAVQCGERRDGAISLGGTPLGIEAHLPEGDVASRATVSVVFDRPVARLGDADPTLAEGRRWLVLEPTSDGHYHWVGTRTLTFTAANGLPPATLFSARVPAGVRALDGATLQQDVEWSFTTPRPALVASVPAAGDSLARPGDPIVLRFNNDVEPQAVAAAASLERGTTWRASRPDSALRAELDSRFWDAQDNELVRLDPEPRLERDRPYVLRIAAGMRGRGGSLGLAEAIEIPFRTYGAPGLVAALASGPGGVRLVFRTPVDADSARARLVFDPPVKVENVWQDGTTLHVWGGLGYETTFTVTAPAGLTDVFGQRFDAPQSVTFTSAEREPTLQLLPREAVLLPGTSRTVALVASGMGPIRVRAARVTARDEIRARNEPISTRRWTFERKFPASADVSTLVSESIDLTSLLPKSRLGAVVVEAQATPRSDGKQPWETRAVLRFSDLGVSTKVSAENGLVWTTHMTTGEPWSGVEVSLVDATGQSLWRGKSDRRGLAELPGLRTLARDPWQVSLVAVSGGDTATSGLQGDWRIDPWRFDIPGAYGTPPVAERAFLWGDRDVFRPGDTVRLAGWVRGFVASGLAPCSLDSVTIAVRDPMGRVFVERRVDIDGSGALALDLELPATAAIGRYSVEALALITRPGERQRRAGGARGAGGAGAAGASAGAGAAGATAPAPKPQILRHTLGHFGFEIAAFRAPVFRVAVTPAARHVFTTGGARSRSIAARIDASYYFGAPLAGATVQWQATRQRQAFAPRAFAEFSFDDPELEVAHGGLLASGRGALGDSGTAQVQVDLPPELPQVTQTVLIEATVRDAGGDVVSSHAGMLLHPTPTYAGVRVTRDFVTAGEPMTAEFIAVRADTAITVAGTPLTVQLIRRDWRAVRKLLVGGRVGYETVAIDSVIETRTAASAAEPIALQFTPQEAGSYRVRVVAAAPGGQPGVGGPQAALGGQAGVASFWVAGNRAGAFPPTDAVRIELATDRRTYQVGDVARILVTTPVRTERALLTIEREGLLESRIVDLRAGGQVIEVEIKPEYLPNVYAGIAAVEPALSAQQAPSLPETARLPRYVAGYVPLTVDVAKRRLSVEVTPAQSVYAPQDRARLRVQLRDANGAATAGTVALAVVDEAVLALLGTPVPDPFAFFYDERALGVATADTRLRLSAGSRLESAAFKAGTAGGDGAAKLAARSMFTTTAYWNPRVAVGPDGHAEVDFTLPDNLTSFRVVALAMSGVDRFGAGKNSFQVAKSLTVDSALPRFVQEGDSLELACVVTNMEGKALRVDVQVSTESANLEILSKPQAQVQLAAGESRRVAFRARAVQAGAIHAGEASVRFDVRSTKAGAKGAKGATGATGAGATPTTATDAIVRTLPITPNTIARVAATAMRGLGTEGIAVPARAIAPPRLDVTLAASAVAGAEHAFRNVIEYPYGCLEQRASRLLVLLLQRDVLDRASDPAAIDAAIREIEGMMSQWGGFTFWDGGDQAPDWMQAYALLALSRARAAGHTVTDNVIEGSTWRVVRMIREGPNNAAPVAAAAAAAPPAARDAALAHAINVNQAQTVWWAQSAPGLGLYAVSQAYRSLGDATPVQPADLAVVAENASRLQEHDRMFLALAFHAWSRRPELVQQILQDVLRRAEVTAATAQLSPAPSRRAASGAASAASATAAAAAAADARFAPFRTGARATSLALWLASAAQPTTPIVPKLASGLLDMRRGGDWQTTQDDALALLALAQYREAVERRGDPVRVQASIGVAAPAFVVLDAPAGALERRSGSIEILPAVAPTGATTLSIDGQGIAHTTASLHWLESASKQEPREAGYALTRRIDKLDEDSHKSLRVGDLILITLEIAVPRESYYLALVDPLPAAFEIVQPHFHTESSRAATAAQGSREERAQFASLPVSHVERRDRELRVFADHVPAGIYAHRYVARVRAAGAFAHPPATIEAMYTPELQAMTSSGRLRTTAPESKRGSAR